MPSANQGSVSVPFYPLTLFGVKDVQPFIGAGGTWSKPAGCTYALICCIGPGGGGGGGIVAANTISGGAGGGAGGGAFVWLPVSSLPASATVQVGTGGAGGAGVTNTTGNDGSPGSANTI